MPRTSRPSRTAMMRANVAVPIDRYSQLLEVLHRHGFGTFIVKMRGRRPVSVARVEQPTRLLEVERNGGRGAGSNE